MFSYEYNYEYSLKARFATQAPTERDRDSGTESGGDTGTGLPGDLSQRARSVKSSRVRLSPTEHEPSGRPATVATSEPRTEDRPPNDD